MTMTYLFSVSFKKLFTILFFIICLLNMKILYADECLYDVSPLPEFTGTVSRVTADGILFTDGTDIALPESLLRYPRMEETLKIRGLKSLNGKKIWAFSIEKDNKVICPSAHDISKGAYPGSSSYDDIKPGMGIITADQKEEGNKEQEELPVEQESSSGDAEDAD